MHNSTSRLLGAFSTLLLALGCCGVYAAEYTGQSLTDFRTDCPETRCPYIRGVPFTTMSKFSAETQSRIAEAIAFVQDNPDIKLTKVAVKFLIPYDQFTRRLKGRPASNSRGGHNKALDDTQEDGLRKYINFLIHIGKNPNLRTIQQAANSILRASGSTRILGRAGQRTGLLETKLGIKPCVPRLWQLKEKLPAS